jgi:hypothetical protein
VRAEESRNLVVEPVHLHVTRPPPPIDPQIPRSPPGARVDHHRRNPGYFLGTGVMRGLVGRDVVMTEDAAAITEAHQNNMRKMEGPCRPGCVVDSG